MLKDRLLTALFLIPIALLAIWFLPAFYFELLITLILIVGAWEWSKLAGFSTAMSRFNYVIAALLGLFCAYWLPPLPVLVIGLLTWLWASAAIWSYDRGFLACGFQYPAWRAVIGLLVLIPCWTGFAVLKSGSLLGPGWLCFAVLIIWAADSGAYFSGRFLGKHALASKVSPKKTWEGFFGGLVLAVVVAIIGGLFFNLTFWQHWYLLMLAILTALFSVIGDLTISLVKRISGVKDTGSVFPGHGGVLDRLDSVAAAIVLFALGSLLLGF